MHEVPALLPEILLKTHTKQRVYLHKVPEIFVKKPKVDLHKVPVLIPEILVKTHTKNKVYSLLGYKLKVENVNKTLTGDRRPV